MKRARPAAEILDFDPSEFTGPAAGSKRLYYAVLCDAIRCLIGEATPRRERAMLKRLDRRWVASPDTEGPFSFVSTCEVLGLPVRKLRKALLAPKLKIDIVLDRAGRSHRRALLPVEMIRAAVKRGTPIKTLASRYGVPARNISPLVQDILQARLPARNAAIRHAHRVEQLSYQVIADRWQLSKSTIGRICEERPRHDLRRAS